MSRKSGVAPPRWAVGGWQRAAHPAQDVGGSRPLAPGPWPRAARLRSEGGRTTVAVVLASFCFSLVVLVAPVADPRPAPREITLVARDMAFYLSDGTQAGPNPTLRLKVGEEVRIVLRNQDPGISHTFAVRAWKVALTLPHDEVGSILVRAPQRTGRYDYVCTPHSRLMAGVIEVVDND